MEEPILRGTEILELCLYEGDGGRSCTYLRLDLAFHHLQCSRDLVQYLEVLLLEQHPPVVIGFGQFGK